MRKEYEIVELEIVKIEREDIITSSPDRNSEDRELG